MAGEVTITQGGTNSATASAARAALGVYDDPTSIRRVGAGQTYATIAAAVAAASNGDQILVYPGSYSENVSTTKYLYFKSFLPRQATWSSSDAAAGSSTLTIGPSAGAGSSETVYEGFKFTGNDNPADGRVFKIIGIAASLGTTIRFKDCNFQSGSSSTNMGQVQNTVTTNGMRVVFENCNFASGGAGAWLQADECEQAYPLELIGCTGYLKLNLGTAASIANVKLLNCNFTSGTANSGGASANRLYARNTTGVTYGAAAAFTATEVIDTERVFLSGDIIGTGAGQSTAHSLNCIPRNVRGWLVDVDADPVAVITLTSGAHTNTNLVFTCPAIGKYRVSCDG